MRWPRRNLHALSGAYALDAVGAAERKRFERHLARCASCQREVSRLQEAASRFAVAVSARPPARLRRRVLDAVASDAQASQATGTRPREAQGPVSGLGEARGPVTGPREAQGPVSGPGEARGPVTGPGEARGAVTGRGEAPGPVTRPQEAYGSGTLPRRVWEAGWVRKVAIPLAAACLALAVVFGVLYAVAQGRLSSSRTQEDQIADVLSAPGTRVIARKTSIGGVVIVDVASAIRELVVTTLDMPGLPPSKAYQVWVLGPGGKAASDGLLTRIPDHRTAPVLAARLARGDKMGLTVEPAGGTAKPTTRPIVDIPVPA
jgi:anti-sigma-K factor RskA